MFHKNKNRHGAELTTGTFKICWHFYGANELDLLFFSFIFKQSNLCKRSKVVMVVFIFIFYNLHIIYCFIHWSCPNIIHFSKNFTILWIYVILAVTAMQSIYYIFDAVFQYIDYDVCSGCRMWTVPEVKDLSRRAPDDEKLKTVSEGGCDLKSVSSRLLKLSVITVVCSVLPCIYWVYYLFICWLLSSE